MRRMRTHTTSSSLSPMAIRTRKHYLDHLIAFISMLPDRLNSWAATLVDGFDTMIIMGLDDLTRRSIPHIANMTFDAVSVCTNYCPNIHAYIAT